MAATLDKDTLIKHSFWILAGCYVVLVLACLGVLATSVSDTVRKEEDDLKKAQDVVKGITDPKNQSVVEAFKKQDQLVDKKKDEVWGKAWETQKDMMTWPRKLQSQFARYKYFGDPIDQFDRAPFEDAYREQLKEVWEVVQPVMPNGEGVVQCKGDWAEVLQLDKSFPQRPPSKDDIWLTQEELWVKREMLRIIRDANQLVARFKEVVPDSRAEKDNKIKTAVPAEKDAKGAKLEAAAAEKDVKVAKPVSAPLNTDARRKVFQNPYWKFDLTLVGPEKGKYFLRGKLINAGKRKQSLDTKFKVFLQDPGAVQDPSFVLISPADLPLAVGESKEINEPVPEQNAIEGLFGVEQVLNWRTAAVKRLDDLRLMYASSRTAVRTLKPPKFLNTPPATEASDSSASGDTSSATATPGAPGATSPYGAEAAGPATTTLNGLDINRYTDVSDQVRHMPVAMVVVVDEEHLPELLAAFVNSKLRIQITQYHWQHCRERMNPVNQEEIPQYTPGTVSGTSRERPIISSGSRGPAPGMLAGQRYGVNNPALLRGGPSGGGGERSQVGRPMPGGPGLAPIGRPSVTGGSGISRPAYRPTTPATSATEQEEEQEDLNLLEVAVYGLASLYERYPPPPPKPAEQTAPEEKPAASSTGGN